MTNSAGWQSLENLMVEELHRRQGIGRLRTLRVRSEPGTHIDLTTNDYLGLSQVTDFQEDCRRAIHQLPVGSGASRLLGGEHEIYGRMETAFAQFKGAEAALFFPSGYAANEAIMTALNLQNSLFLSDQLNHASLIDGMHLARLAPGQKNILPHNDLAVLEKLLQNSTALYNVIVTEALFSMDGDQAPLRQLKNLADQYRGVLVVDEAHSIGCWGNNGRGLIDAAGLSHDQIITINTCGKAMAVQGAFVCGPQWLKDYLINTARPFIYTTAPSPWIAAAVEVALRWLPTLNERRNKLFVISERLRESLMDLGFETRPSSSYIIPVFCGTDERALKLEHHLAQHGILARAIRPPTVPEGASRVRLSLSAQLQDSDIDRILEAFSTARGTLLS